MGWVGFGRGNIELWGKNSVRMASPSDMVSQYTSKRLTLIAKRTGDEMRDVSAVIGGEFDSKMEMN